MSYRDEEKCPAVMGGRNLLLAVALHLVLVVVFVGLAKIRFRAKEVVIPIDLTVVVNENLDGEENEPPPLDNPPPEPPPTPKPPKVKPLPPPPVEKVPDAVVKVHEKKVEEKKPEKKVEEKKPEKKVEEKKPEKPKEKTKSRAELIREKMNKQKVKTVVPNAPSGNGKTDKKTLTDDQVRKLLDQGYKPGKSEQIAKDEVQRCVSLIQRAFEAKWDQVGRPPWSADLRVILLDVQFGSGGRVRGYRISSSSGSSAADQTVLKAAALVQAVTGLSEAFIRENKTVSVRFKVTP